MRLTISIVTFNNEDVIEKALTSIEQSTLPPYEYDVMVVDNSSTDRTPDIIASKFPEISLTHSKNIGYGAGHNKAIKTISKKSDYHLVMNPDVYFGKDVLEKLIAFLDEHPQVGLLMPKILYPDNQLQYLCKQLPTPFDLIGRRFIPGFLKPIFKKRLERYEFKDRDYNRVMEVPHLSGCFMMLRTEVFEKVGLFDERFFMYLEDVDYSRRVHAHYKNLYYPGVSIYHQYHKGSYKRWKHLRYHIVSAVKYFNKWGWFIDPQRKAINISAAGVKKPFY
ncbi:MAG: glycosyltransferase [Candidatus Aminicenantes bacterium]|nr:MAG: glycosyltransferase [Candidatus Aminicenantes bacterium]